MSNRMGNRPKLGTYALLLALTLAGCRKAGDDPYYANTAYLSRQDVVPLTHALPLSTSASPLVLDFELPPPGEGASSLLIFALRKRSAEGSSDEAELRLAIDDARKNGLSAQISLQRLESESATNVPLTRPESMPDNSTEYVPLGSGTNVEHVWFASIDLLSLQAAGLSYSYEAQQELALAQVQHPIPGKYRLTLQFLGPPKRIARLSSELLIAYGARPK